jgi:ATP-dependent helicase YprA (DUF1998 family)
LAAIAQAERKYTNVFEIRNRLITDYGHFVRGFMHIHDAQIRDKVEEELCTGLLWPEPLIQQNSSFEPGAWLDALVDDGILHAECRKIFRKDKSPSESAELGKPLRLHTHQTEAIQVARAGHNSVLTTGTGSGKGLVYIIPTDRGPCFASWLGPRHPGAAAVSYLQANEV